MFGRTKIAMIVAEFLGAATLTVAWLAVSRSGLGFALFIAAAVGLALGLTTLIVGSASGAHYNPAVTLGLWSVRRIQTFQAAVYIAAQLLGGLVAGTLFVYLSTQSLTSVAGTTFDWRILAAEALGAFVLSLGVTSASVQGYKGLKFATTVGGALFLGALAASLASNGLINPALALGVKSWSTAYVAGPLLGAVVGANLYIWLFAPAEARPKFVVASSSKKTVAKSKAKATKSKTVKKTVAKKVVTKKPVKKTRKK